jgi:hypothetical protein
MAADAQRIHGRSADAQRIPAAAPTATLLHAIPRRCSSRLRQIDIGLVEVGTILCASPLQDDGHVAARSPERLSPPWHSAGTLSGAPSLGSLWRGTTQRAMLFRAPCPCPL